MKKEYENIVNEKLCILVTGPTCSGKSTCAMNLSRAIPNIVYLDKDDAVILSNWIFYTNGEPVDRQGDFFKKYVRMQEYEMIEAMALRALLFADRVIINAPYGSETDVELEGGSSERLRNLKQKINERGGKLMVVFLNLTKETATERWQKRFSEDPDAAKRTPKALENLEDYQNEQHLDLPAGTTIPDADYFVLFDAQNSEKAFCDLKAFLGVSSDEPYDCDITRKPFMGAAKFDTAQPDIE